MEVIEDECPGYLDDMSNKRRGGDLRIFFQNIGTLKLGMQTDVSEEAVEIMHGLGVDIAGLTEIKFFGNPVVRGQADRIFQRNMGGAVITVAENEGCVVKGFRSRVGSWL